METRIPTHAGDILVLRTATSYTVHVVGRITNDGQQDFTNQKDLEYERDPAEAIALAKRLRLPGRRIFLVDVDTNTWSEIPDANSPVEREILRRKEHPPSTSSDERKKKS